MILGKYDRDGYQGADYSNICAGTVAEATRGTVAQDLIASAGNIADFYSGGTDATGDDVATLTHTFDCLADFMGTSQDGVAYNFNTHTYNDNANGGTTFYYYNNGTRDELLPLRRNRWPGRQRHIRHLRIPCVLWLRQCRD